MDKQTKRRDRQINNGYIKEFIIELIIEWRKEYESVGVSNN